MYVLLILFYVLFNYCITALPLTGFSKGWKEAFMSGDQEPWVFRGGLIADLQRLMPIDQGNDLFLYELPDHPTTDYYSMRPYHPLDEAAVNQVCTQGFLSLVSTQPPSAEGEAAVSLELNGKFTDLIADSIIGPFVTIHPEFCIVATDTSNKVVGYAAAALDFSAFSRNALMCWIPEMKEKYPESLEEQVNDIVAPHSEKTSDILRAMIKEFHTYEPQCHPEVSSSYPAVMTAAVVDHCLTPDYGVAKRLITVLLATLRANGCFGVHIRLPAKDMGLELLQFYLKLGFGEILRDGQSFIYLGRRF